MRGGLELVATSGALLLYSREGLRRWRSGEGTTWGTRHLFEILNKYIVETYFSRPCVPRLDQSIDCGP